MQSTDSSSSSESSSFDGSTPRFERIEVEGLEAARFVPDPEDLTGFGPGAALVDLRGDGLLDLFLGADTTGTHTACVYRNVSTPVRHRFAPVPELCGVFGNAIAGLALPVEGEAREELLVLGENRLDLVRWPAGGPPQVETFFAQEITLENREENCVAGSALLVDLTLDGHGELLIGCQASELSDYDEQIIYGRNRILQRAPGEIPQMLPAGTFPVYEDEGNALALAHVDLEENGLPDVIVVNDTFSMVNRRLQGYPPGHFLRRCSPTESCSTEQLLVADDTSAWGSFMGVTELRVEGERAWYITDLGPNRLLHYREGRLVDVASERKADLSQRRGYQLFAWAALTDDFSGDGEDEVFVSHGHVQLTDSQQQRLHRDGILQLQPDGRFAFRSESVGFPIPAIEADQEQRYRSSRRAAARVDLNLDGRLELLVIDYNGAPQVYREVVPADRPLRCNVDPVSRLVPTVGTGFSFAPAGTRDFRTWDIQGQMRFGLPTRLLLPWQQGVLRFPSGAEVPWDCAGGPGPLRIEEPDWLVLEEVGDSLRVLVSAPWLFGEQESVPVRAHWLVDDPADPLALVAMHQSEALLSTEALQAGWMLMAPADADALLLEIAGRLVPRRFALHD